MKHVTYSNTTAACPANITPQVRHLRTALTAAFGEEEFTMKTVAERITQADLQTRQAPERIFAYYVKNLVEAGLLVKNVTDTGTKDAPISKKAQVRQALEDALALVHEDPDNCEMHINEALAILG